MTAMAPSPAEGVSSPIPAGANVIGKVNLQVGAADLSGSNPAPVYLAPIAGNAPINLPIYCAATTNNTSVKTGAATVFGIHLYNAAAAVRAFRLFDLNVAPAPGTQDPALLLVVPATTQLIIPFPRGLQLVNGLAYSITAAATRHDSTNCAANDVMGSILYI